MTFDAQDTKLIFNGIEFPIVSEVIHSYDRENGPREERLLGPSPTSSFAIKCDGLLSVKLVELFRWLSFRLFPGRGYTGDWFMRSCACLAAVVEHRGVGRSMLGRNAWVIIGEQQTPIHRRSWMTPYWVKAMQARYWVNTLDDNGKPIGSVRGFYLKGNQREVIEAYDRIRREAGDFSVDDLGGLN